VRKHRHWDAIGGGGVAAHHGRSYAVWKLLIEKMMSAVCSMRFSRLPQWRGRRLSRAHRCRYLRRQAQR